MRILSIPILGISARYAKPEPPKVVSMSKKQLPYAEAWRYCQKTLRVVPPVLKMFYVGALLDDWDIRYLLIDFRTGYTLQALQSVISEDHKVGIRYTGLVKVLTLGSSSPSQYLRSLTSGDSSGFEM